MKKLALLAVVTVALASTALAAGAGQHPVKAHLSARAEVPRPIGATKKAAGAFTGAYVVQGTALKLKWKLSFNHLTGVATAATLRKAKPGLIGEQITVLCKPCKSGASATTLMHKSVLKALSSGRTYVMIYTKRNPAGEIRGQILARR
ncbi:MAG: CHRD domain-containing protein [Gaiellaceae bacterium]|jgi:opacity protein-like surface antigen